MNTVTQLGISAADSFSKLINESADVIFNIVPVMMYKTDEEGVILKVNPDGCRPWDTKAKRLWDNGSSAS